MQVFQSSRLAQLVERRTFNPVVAGSSPAVGDFYFMLSQMYFWLVSIIFWCKDGAWHLWPVLDPRRPLHFRVLSPPSLRNSKHHTTVLSLDETQPATTLMYDLDVLGAKYSDLDEHLRWFSYEALDLFPQEYLHMSSCNLSRRHTHTRWMAWARVSTWVKSWSLHNTWDPFFDELAHWTKCFVANGRSWMLRWDIRTSGRGEQS